MQDMSGLIIKELGDGLVMRYSKMDDAERLAEFNGRIHGEDAHDTVRVASWTRDLLTKAHPTFRKSDFVIIEKPETGEIVSTTNLISQTWMYDGIPFGVGRPELVGTLPEYRNRGLVRIIFEAIHALSRQRGELVQAITGIPYFYRQFGYEMTVNLGGGRMGFPGAVPKLDEGQPEPFTIRPAAEADIPYILRLMEQENRRWLLTCQWDEALLRHEMFDKSFDNVNHVEVRIIETPQGRPIGYITHPGFVWSGSQVALYLTHFELEQGQSYLAVTPTVLRYLWSTGQAYAVRDGLTADAIGFSLSADHLAYTAAGSKMPVKRDPYAYYMRVADLPAFLRHICPVLEKRLAESGFAGHTGTLKIGFYRRGLGLTFEDGRITAIEDWKPEGHDTSAEFPDLTFLHMVFGHRTLDEIRNIFVDCWANDEARALLGVLFPKKVSSVWPIS